jgi:hypothetical protein
MNEDVNLALILSVSEEVRKVDPVFDQKVKLFEGKDSEVRIKAGELIKSFPWPIGIELRRLFSMRQPNFERLNHLLKTAERTTQFLAFILVIELYEDVLAGKPNPSDSFKKEFGKMFTQLSFGTITWLVRTVGNLFTSTKKDLFMKEMEGLLTPQFYKSLDMWVEDRNAIAHGKVNLDDRGIANKCKELCQRLTVMLCGIAFIVKYRLVTMREIRVSKLRHRKVSYFHSIDLLSVSEFEDNHFDKELEAFSDSESVLLMKDIGQPMVFLNLSPLIIDTRVASGSNLKKNDIFMYNKIRDNKLTYIGTEVTEEGDKLDFSSLSIYDYLLTDFRQMMDKLGTPTTKT